MKKKIKNFTKLVTPGPLTVLVELFDTLSPIQKKELRRKNKKQKRILY